MPVMVWWVLRSMSVSLSLALVLVFVRARGLKVIRVREEKEGSSAIVQVPGLALLWRWKD